MRKWLLRLGWTLFGLILLIVVAGVVVRLTLHGPRLARFLVDNFINPEIRGRLEVESVEWRLADLYLGGGKLPIVVKNVTIWEPLPDRETGEPKIVAQVSRARGTVHLLPLVSLSGRPDFVFEDIVVEPGFWDEALGRSPWVHIEGYDVEGQPFYVGLTHAFLPPPREKKSTPRPGPITDLRSVRLDGVRVSFDFPYWDAELFDVSIPNGSLIFSQRDPTRDDDLGFTSDELVAGRATLDVVAGTEVWHFDFDPPVIATELFIERGTSRMDYDLVATTVEGAEVHAKGALTDVFAREPGVELEGTVTKAGPLLARLSHGVLRGEGARLWSDVRGDLSTPDVELELYDTEIAGTPAVVEEARAKIALKTGAGTLERLSARGLGGHLAATGAFDAYQYTLSADVTIDEPVDLSQLELPRSFLTELRRTAGGTTLAGALSLDVDRRHIHARRVSLAVGRGGRVTGEARYVYDGSVVRSDGLTVSAAGARATASGDVHTRQRRLALSVNATAGRLGPWLRRLGAPDDVARSAEASGTVTGPFHDLEAAGTVTARGVPVAGRVSAALRYRKGELTVRRLQGSPLGGQLSGSGTLLLSRDEVRVESATVSGFLMDLAKIPGLEGRLSGVAHFRGNVEGRVSSLHGEVSAGADDVRLSGYLLGDASSQLTLDPDGVTVHSLHMGSSSRGTLDVVGRIGYDGSLDLSTDLRRLPLSTFPITIDGEDDALRGWASMRGGRIQGTVLAPEPSGVLQVSELLFRDSNLGDGSFTLEPQPGGRLGFSARFVDDRLKVQGTVSLLPPFDLVATVDLDRFPVERVFPELREALDARARVTGRARVRLDDAGFVADASFSQMELEIKGQDRRGRPRPVIVKNLDPVALHYDKGVLRFEKRTRFQGPTGEFTVEGWAGLDGMNLGVGGRVELALLEFFFGRYFDESRGNASVNIRATGDPRDPQLTGALTIRDAAVRPRGQETEIRLPAAQLTLEKNKVEIGHLFLDVDEHVLSVTGNLTLEGLQPDKLDVKVQGRIAAQLIRVLAGRQFSGAKGSARIDVLAVTGDADNPDINGVLTFDREFELNPRGLGHDVVFAVGQVQFSNQSIAFKDVRGQIDDASMYLLGNPQQCSFEGFCTAVRLYQWTPIDVYIDLRMYGITHRIPGVLQVEADTELVLSGDSDELQLRGQVAIVHGRYVQGFDVGEFLTPKRTAERTKPFWEGNPLLESLRLHIEVDSRGSFAVKNNLADLTLEGSVTLTGTPPSPRLDGVISAEAGEINARLLGLRPKFKLTSGTVTFSELGEMPRETPNIDLVAEAVFQDLDNQTHNVTLRFEGTLGRFRWDLSTDTGLNTPQTYALLVTGRSDANDLIRGSGAGTAFEQTPGFDSASPIGQASPIDIYVKQYLGDLIATLIEDPLKNVLQLCDSFRFEPGTESWRLQCSRNIGPRVKAEAEHEQGLVRGSRSKLGVSAQVSDNLSADAFLQKDVPTDEAEQERSRLRAQAKFRFEIP